MTGASPAAQPGKRVLAIHRYYWPDSPPYASMLRQIVGHWQQQGHTVEVLSSQPSYKQGVDHPSLPSRDEVDGVAIRRLALPNETGRPGIRVANALRLALAVLWYALRGRFDVIMISTAPPVVGGFAAAVAARLTGARFIYHCMDIHPEVGRVSGEFSRPAVFRALRRLDSWTCRRADPVVVLSADMANTFRQRPRGAQSRLTIINNFNLPDDDQMLPSALPCAMEEGVLNVLFAGNVGRFQGLDIVVDAMAGLKHRTDIRFVIMGEGAAKQALQERAIDAGANIEFVDHQPVVVAKAVMRAASFGFVSLMPDVIRYAYPSKTMTYLAEGCPLIVAVESDSELARSVGRDDIGYHVPVNDAPALAALLERIADHERDQIAHKSRLARSTAKREFEQGVVMEQWTSLLADTWEPA